MDPERLDQLLNDFPERHVLVVGDYFLDKYLILDRALSETSLETGLEAYQVAAVRPSPGAAGSVVNNLRALGVRVTALTVIGDDGEGYELRRALAAQGVDVEHIIQTPGRFTPTYTKPMMREEDGRLHELNRLDIKNRSPLPEELQREMGERMGALAERANAIIVADQVEEEDCGVITAGMRQTLADLGRANGELVIAVDSRHHIGQFRHAILKPNLGEALAAVGSSLPVEGFVDPALRETAGRELQRRTGRPVFLTSGADGIFVFTGVGLVHVPGIALNGPLDIVGAGDSVMASLVSALCCGASEMEAAWVGNLAASITVQQIGTTGTADRQQIRRRNAEALAQMGRIL